jgi:hypothetical protein
LSTIRFIQRLINLAIYRILTLIVTDVVIKDRLTKVFGGVVEHPREEQGNRGWKLCCVACRQASVVIGVVAIATHVDASTTSAMNRAATSGPTRCASGEVVPVAAARSAICSLQAGAITHDGARSSRRTPQIRENAVIAGDWDQRRLNPCSAG